MKLLPLTLPEGIEFRTTTVLDCITCRDGTYDAYVVHEIKRSYGKLDLAGKRVLDIGGNIGAFTRFAKARGAEKVVAMEPERSNFECLLWNTCDLVDIRIINGCADTHDGSTTIYTAPSGKNPGNTSQQPKRGRTGQNVACYDVYKIMDDEAIDTVKFDCEGAEYNIGWAGKLPSRVTQVAMELHFTTKGDFEKAEELVKTYKDWETVLAPKMDRKAWATLAVWRR